ATSLGQPPVSHASDDLPATARDALDRLDAGYRVARGYLDATTEETLAEPIGEAGGPWADDDRASFVLHMLDELIHHAAEIAVLRDLYRATRPPNPVVDALLDGDR